MEDQNKPKALTQEEEKEYREGNALYEMIQNNAGWQVVKEWLLERLNHTWVDPRGKDKDQWDWAELSAFHSADVARVIFEDIEKAIQKADYLGKVKSGEIITKHFKI